MKISYYELLGMIKEGNIPERIKVCLVGNKEVVYIAEFETEYILLCYMIENENEQDENYRYYLSECLIEYSMFDECIEIIEEEKEIEHYDLVDNYEVMNDKIIANNFEHINEELEWLVREIKKLKKE